MTGVMWPSLSSSCCLSDGLGAGTGTGALQAASPQPPASSRHQAGQGWAELGSHWPGAASGGGVAPPLQPGQGRGGSAVWPSPRPCTGRGAAGGASLSSVRGLPPQAWGSHILAHAGPAHATRPLLSPGQLLPPVAPWAPTPRPGLPPPGASSSPPGLSAGTGSRTAQHGHRRFRGTGHSSPGAWHEQDPSRTIRCPAGSGAHVPVPAPSPGPPRAHRLSPWRHPGRGVEGTAGPAPGHVRCRRSRDRARVPAPQTWAPCPSRPCPPPWPCCWRWR